MLLAYCYVMKLKYEDLRFVVGVAMESQGERGQSESLAFIDDTGWDDEARQRAREAQAITGILTEPIYTEVHEEEYPGP